jgi:hypothetical protein
MFHTKLINIVQVASKPIKPNNVLVNVIIDVTTQTKY